MARARKKAAVVEVEDDLEDLEELEEIEDEDEEEDEVEVDAKVDADEEEDEDEEEEDEDEEVAPKKAKKKAKKPRKRDDGKVGSAELAAALGTDGRNLRVLLRQKKVAKNENNRYEWDSIDEAMAALKFKSLDAAKKALKASRDQRLTELKDRVSKSKASQELEEIDDDEDEDEVEEAPPPKKKKRRAT